jgi:hypothetical protein
MAKIQYQFKGLKKGFSICLISILFVKNTSMGQQSLSLNKNEMFTDFDTLLTKLQTVSPHIPIKKRVWGYDAIAQIKTLRKEIDTISSDESFLQLINRALIGAQDEHTSLWSSSAGHQKQMNMYLPVVYDKGNYLIAKSFVVGNDTALMGSHIEKINGTKIDAYIKAHMTDRYYRFDAKRKKFYSEFFYDNLQTVERNQIALSIQNPIGKTVDFALSTNKELHFLVPNMDTTFGVKIYYWEDTRTLYIKLFVMEKSFIKRFKTGIDQYRSKNIDKIIIDLRNNGGGSDSVWESLYAYLLPEKFSYQVKIDGYPPYFMPKSYLAQSDLDIKSIQKEKNSLLSGLGLYTYLYHTETIIPDDSSIRFRGKIIVLGENIYSSAGSAMSVPNAYPHDNIISVGRRSDVFLGVGYSPVVFHLPNSGIEYRISPSIEVTNIKTLNDIMQDHYEIEVPFSKGELENKNNYMGNSLGSYYLQHFDPFIKIALSL